MQHPSTPHPKPRRPASVAGSDPGPNPPDPDGVIVVPNGRDLSFVAPTSLCAAEPCTYAWACTATDPNGGAPTTFDGEGENFLVTTGTGSLFDVDMTLVAVPRNVSCVCTITDDDGEVVDGEPQLGREVPTAPSCAAQAAPSAIVQTIDHCKVRAGGGV
jgi:hypothetical protein